MVKATTNTLVGVNGLWIVGLLSVPVFFSLAAWIGLHLRCSRGGSLGSRLARSAIALLCAFALVSMFSIGFLVLPAALLLVVAARLTPAGPATAETT